MALAGLPVVASAKSVRSNVVAFVRDVPLNGQRMLAQQAVQAGDHIQTGPNSRLVFAIGNAAFHLRQKSRLQVGRSATLNTVRLRRLLSGAVVGVFGRGSARTIATPTFTDGIRGTGTYTEVMPGKYSCFCNCYGAVGLTASRCGRFCSTTSRSEAQPSQSLAASSRRRRR